MALTAIFAASYDEAQRYARDNQISERDALYVSDTRILDRGYAVTNAVVLPGFHQHRQAAEIAARAFC